jgi:hydroxymethylglutaryl-CoA lyase
MTAQTFADEELGGDHSGGISIVEVGPRDGFQSVGPIIATDEKIAIIKELYAAGVRRMEATSFVSTNALPQMADAVEVLTAAQALPGLDVQVLVPTERQAQRALDFGARHLVFVLSVSEAHNRSNVRRSPAESVEEYSRIAQLVPEGVKMRLNLATAFDCPYDGRVASGKTLDLLDQLLSAYSAREVALCDTTGRVDPAHVAHLTEATRERWPAITWAFHAHDTYGLGAANTLAAWNSGIRVFDAAVAGLGGCPFAPGATGNVATEDLLWMFEGMGIGTGIDLATLVGIAQRVKALPGAQVGGRVRDALTARSCATEAVEA